MQVHRKENNGMEDLGVNGKMMLKWIFFLRNGMEGFELMYVAKDTDAWRDHELSYVVTWGVS